MNAAARRPGSLERALGRLAAEFGRFTFGTQRGRNGTALAAVRRKPDEPGLYAIITDDPQEMREALQHDMDHPPGSQEQPGGDQPADPGG